MGLFWLTSSNLLTVITNLIESLLVMPIYPNVCLPLKKDKRMMLSYGVDNSEGCYAAFGSDGICLYVGRSTLLLKRIMSHFIDQNDGFGVRWRLKGTIEWYFKAPFAPLDSLLQVWFNSHHRELELFLIQHLNPRFNTHYVRKTLRLNV